MRFAAGVGIALSIALANTASADGEGIVGGVTLPVETMGAHARLHRYWDYHQQWHMPRPGFVPPLRLARPNSIWNGVLQPESKMAYPYPPYGEPKAGFPYYAYGIPYAGHPGFYQFYYPHVMVYPKAPAPNGYGYGYYGRPNAITVPGPENVRTDSVVTGETNTEEKPVDADAIDPNPPVDVSLPDTTPAPPPKEAARPAPRFVR